MACYLDDYNTLPEVVQARRLKQKNYSGTLARVESQKKYQASEKGKQSSRRHARAHRERKIGFHVPVPRGYENLIFQVFNNRCAACGAASRLALDHHQPLRMGYPLLHNAVPLCKSCNSRKHALPPQFFYNAEQLDRIENLLRRARAAFEERFGGQGYTGNSGGQHDDR